MGDLETDYIIVGGGLTGCAIASRLYQQNASLQITILEAGKDATSNPLTRNVQGAFALAGSELDHNYKSTPQRHTHDRIHNITAGKVLGGGSILNYGYWARGDAEDYNQWAELVEDECWSYQSLLPYMKKTETHFKAYENPGHRGSDGPIHVTSVLDSDPKRKYGLRAPIRAAWEEAGVMFNPHGNFGSQAGICEFHENWKHGQRQPSNLAYDLKGLKIVTGALVHKVLFQSDEYGMPSASGVLLVNGQRLKARKEVILSAGAIKTPQILMLSGIGPAELLLKHEIPLVRNNNEVGKNYFDHFAHFQLWKLRDPEDGLSMGSPQWKEPALDKGLPCDWAVNEGTPTELLRPAVETDGSRGKISDPSMLNPSRCLVETLVIYSPMAAPVPINGSHISTSVMLLVPTSRGSVNITSSSPMVAPAIDTNFYDTEVDRTILIQGTRRVAQALLRTTAGKSYIQSEEAPPGMAALDEQSSEAEIDARIRATGMSHAHSAGTAAMGKVVDTHLKVKGVKGLRVVDASVFPVAVGGHPQATLYGIAEKAAEMILEDQ